MGILNPNNKFQFPEFNYAYNCEKSNCLHLLRFFDLIWIFPVFVVLRVSAEWFWCPQIVGKHGDVGLVGEVWGVWLHS